MGYFGLKDTETFWAQKIRQEKLSQFTKILNYIKFCLQFNQYQSNIKLYGERFKQEKLIEHFFYINQNGTHKDISIQINDHCDLNDQEGQEDFWSYHLNTMFPKGLNQRKLLRYN